MTAGDAEDLERSLASAQDDGDWTGVLGILGSRWSDLYQSHPQVLIRTIENLPPKVLQANPRLRLAEEHLRRRSTRQPESRAYTDILADDPDAPPLDRLAALTGRIATARGDGRLDDATAAADLAVQTLRAVPVDIIPTFANALPELHYHWGVTYFLANRFDDALEQFARSYDWAASVDNRLVRLTAGGASAFIHAVHGRGRDAARWLAQLPEVPDGAWWAADAPTAARLADAVLHTDRLDMDTAGEILEGIDITLSLDFWGPYFALRAFITTPDRRDDAQVLLSEFDSFVASLAPEYARVQVNADYTRLVRYLLLLLLHQPDRAARELDIAAPSADESLVVQIGATLLARRLLQRDQAAAARRMIVPLLQTSNARPRILIAALTIAAETGAPEQRDDLLQRAAALATWNGVYSALPQATTPARLALADMIEERGEPEIAGLLRVLAEVAAVAGTEALTRREAAVVASALAGLSNTDIAAQQHVSVNTVKSQLRGAFRKLEVSSRQELIALFQLGR
ncbi:LuxR C-terminal-related transcriptional regulator [Microbacterium sp. NPDC090225]|uniref:helix-turn-helix transcriptional regulator n=1 Tax=Microbacterium sp. NPDC090225 TaxID=3364207 RepID=UPI0038293492